MTPSSPLSREVPRRSTAPITIKVVARLLFLVSLALTACVPSESHNVPPILLFKGTGTSANDVAAVETILKDNHLR